MALKIAAWNVNSILARLPTALKVFEEVIRGVPGLDHEHARYIEAVIAAPGGPYRVASLYAPNGNPIGTDKFQFKLQFMAALRAHLIDLLKLEERFVVAGDYNVIPREVDCHDPRVWANDALFQDETRAAYRSLQNLGLADAYMQVDGGAHKYTFWDYQAGAWQKDHGIRIDHLLASPQAADQLVGVEIFKKARGLEKASDHAPIVATFND